MNPNKLMRILVHLKFLTIKRNHLKYTALLSIALGIMSFLFLYGYLPLVFSNVNWIYNAGGDTLQHYLGWLFYRNEPWNFPLGHISTYGYPFGINLAYTDSIPLIAIPLKLISPLLIQRFQFIGFWVLVNIIFQIFFSIRILQLSTQSLAHQIIGGTLLVLSPIMLIRTWVHSSLDAQWVLLASIYLLLLGRDKYAPNWAWPLIFCLEILINPYFLPMSGVFFTVYLFETFRRDRRLKYVLYQIYASGLSVMILGFLIGTIEFPLPSTGGWEYGYYSFNLNALFNPLNSTSAFFSPRPLISSSQWEGYNYPGAGYYLLILSGAGSILFNKQRKDWLKKNAFLIIGCFLLTLFAVTNRVTFDNNILFAIPLPQNLIAALGIFRSSGRFFWPVMYLMVIFGIIRATKTGKRSYMLLVIAFFLQFFDLTPMMKEKDNFIPNRDQSPLQAEFWQNAKTSFKHIELLPADNLIKFYEPFAVYAAEQKMSLNWGYFARAKYARIYEAGVNDMERLKSGEVSSDTIYLFCHLSDVHTILSENPNDHIHFFRVDNFFLGLPTTNEVTQTLPNESNISSQNILDYRLVHFISSFTDQTIFIISTKWDSVTGMDDETRQLLASFGLKTIFPDQSSDGYVAIFGHPLGMNGFEQQSQLTAQLNFVQNERLGNYVLPFDLQVISSSAKEKNTSSIRLNNKEYSSNLSGINIVAYDINNGAIKSKNFYQLYPVVCP